MADPSIFPFIDQLMTKIYALPSCQPPVLVFDGAPGTQLADTVVAIGGTVTPTSIGKQAFAQLGAIAMWEEYYVDGVITCKVAGDTGTGSTNDPQSGNAQRTSRQNATTIFNAIFEAIRADTNFISANGGTPLFLFCHIEDVEVRQYPTTGARNTDIVFKIHVKNRIAAT